MSAWTDDATLQIARRVLGDERAGRSRQQWAASVLAAAEHMGAALAEQDRAAWRRVLQLNTPQETAQ